MRPLSFLLSLCLPLWAAQVDASETLSASDRIYDTRQQIFIEEPRLLGALSDAELILIGEKHDNETHHMLEGKLVKALSALPGGTAVVMEMLPPSAQQRLGQAATRRGTELRDAIGWNNDAWPWQAYGPVIESALDAGASLHAGNIERDTMMAIYRNRALPDTKQYDTARAVSDQVRTRILDALFEEHCKTMPRDKLQPMLLIQLARDAVMADAMLSARQAGNRRSVLISGAYHASRQNGVPVHLEQRAPDAATVIILLVEAAMTADLDALITDYRGDADYLWFTPASTSKDYCAALRPAAGK